VRSSLTNAIMITLVAISTVGAAQVVFAQNKSGSHVNTTQVGEWNLFASRLLKIHRHVVGTVAVDRRYRLGGYANRPKFYREIEFRDRQNGRLLSRVLWERENPKNLHSVDVFFYDAGGRLSFDFSATYMPDFRNAPLQTLINAHHHDEDLHAFRQFDASGNLIFENCRGDYFGTAVDISLDEDSIPPSPEEVPTNLYVSCFGYLPLTAGKLLNPMVLISDLNYADIDRDQNDSAESIERRIAEFSRRILRQPKAAQLYARRGREYFLLEQFDAAIADFDRALTLNDDIDAAYFGRGMAFGRKGKIDEGIRDLSVFINRNPESSLAYTKRGVRYIWKKQFQRARSDLEHAVFLDDRNAEAHDDLGVVLAQTGELDKAVEHFLKARAIEPGYQKVHHNLAMVYYIKQKFDAALASVDQSLRLHSENRSSLLLKVTILTALGRDKESDRVRKRAELLPAGNWSERSSIK